MLGHSSLGLGDGRYNVRRRFYCAAKYIVGCGPVNAFPRQNALASSSGGEATGGTIDRLTLSRRAYAQLKNASGLE
jgi:hypothetical protein